MSVKNAGVSTHLKKSAAKRRKARPRTARRCLGAEQLESRQLMTAAAEFLSGAVPMTVPAPVPWQDQTHPVDALPTINTLNVTTTVSTLAAAGESVAAAANQLVPQDATDGKTSISYLDEPFANHSGGFNGVRYVKCHILISDPGTVYFQDSVKYLFHYDFAKERLAPFLSMTREQFDAVSLHRAGQQAVMATVLMSPDNRELAVQFVGHDAYPREDIAAWTHAIVSAVQSDTPLTVLYMPTYEQTAAAEADRSWFASQGITVADPSRWMRGNVTYAEGWATGRLVHVPAAQISAAYGDGRLRPTDILLLADGVPAEVPFVRGIITLTPATPNSHVAILARNQQIPFSWVQNADEQQRILQLAGQPVLLREHLAGAGVADRQPA